MSIQELAEKFECTENSNYWYSFNCKANARDFMNEIYNKLDKMATMRVTHGTPVVYLIEG